MNPPALNSIEGAVVGTSSGDVIGNPGVFKYRAFLSYSHADAKVAKRLHNSLEGFRIDKDLIGRATPMGPIPKSLRPIFRDREDFTAGHTLTEQTRAALDASAALVVLCSTASAKSHYVNEEIRLFKSRHPERAVIPVIIDGTPDDAERECFPPAVKFRVGLDGSVTTMPADLLAADAREEGDGFDVAVAKVLAGLIGLSTDDIYRRAERARRRHARVRNSVIVGLVLLAVAAMGSTVYGWHQLKTNKAFLAETLKSATNIVSTAVEQAEKYGVPRTATIELLAKAELLFDGMARFGRPTPELRYQKAWMLIQFARNYAIVGDTEKQRARAFEARDLLVKLAAEKPGDSTYQRDLSAAHNEVGDVLLEQGNLGGVEILSR
jgi:MTH538 TIR-like domain (DUF1863)